MTNLSIAAMLFLVACTDSESPLEGEYSCTTTQTTAYSQPYAASNTASATSIALLTDVGDGKLTVELTPTGSLASTACPPLLFNHTGVIAELQPGQSCDFVTPNGNINMVLTFGRLHLSGNGDTMLGDFNGNFSGRLLVDGTAQLVVGRMVQQKTCARI